MSIAERHQIHFGRPDYYPKQKAAIFDERRYSIIEASTKSGKTAGCIGWLLEQALAGQDGWNYWWVAPVSGQADIAFRRAKRALPRGTYVAHETLKTMTLLNGAVLWFKSADKPDSLYGEDVYAAVLDEASRMKEEAYIAVRTTLTYTRGKIRIIGNVRGRKNWAWRLARRAEQGSDPEMGFHRLVAYDAVEAGVLEGEEVEQARGHMPEQFWRELYLAEASDDGGNPFGLQHIEACTGELSAKPATVWGWDLGKRQDYTVGIALDDESRCCQFVRLQGIPWTDIEMQIVEATRGIPALVDSTGLGDPVLDHLQREGRRYMAKFEGFTFNPSSKQKLLEGLMVAVQGHAVRFPPGLIPLELEQFEYQYSRTGVKFGAPEGFHDDCVISLALAVEHRVHRRRAPLRIPDEVLRRAARPPVPVRPFRVKW